MILARANQPKNPIKKSGQKHMSRHMCNQKVYKIKGMRQEKAWKREDRKGRIEE